MSFRRRNVRCMYLRARACVCVCVCLHSYVRMMYLIMCILMYLFVYLSMMYVYSKYNKIFVESPVHISSNVSDNTTCACVRACVYKYIYIYIYIYIIRLGPQQIPQNYPLNLEYTKSRGTRWRSWLRHCATSRKVAVSIPDGVTRFFHWHNSSGRTTALGWLSL
jgi:hypothetical protein